MINLQELREQKPKPAYEKVIDVILQFGNQEFSPSDAVLAAKCFGGFSAHNYDSVRHYANKAIKRLLSTGKIERLSKGQYRLAENKNE